MIVRGLGRVSGGHPQNNEDGSLIYYETDKGFGVHVDADTGVVISVTHRRSGAVIQVDGIGKYDVEGSKELTMEEALDYCNSGGRVEVHTSEYVGAREPLVGKVITHEKQYGGYGEMCGEEICVEAEVSGLRAHLNEWEVGAIYAK